MKNYLVGIGLAIGVALWFSACGNNSDTAAPPAPVIPTTTGLDVNGCTSSQVFNSQYGCLDEDSCQSGYGVIPNSNPPQCVAGDAYAGTASGTWGASLTNINRGAFESLMTAYGGFCNVLTFSFGSWSCSSYSSAGYIIIRTATAVANTATIIIGAGVGDPDYGSFLAQVGEQSYAMQFAAQIYPINNNQGFQLNATNGLIAAPGTVAVSGQGLVVQVENGLLTSQAFSGTVSWQGSQIANAPLQAYTP